MYIKRAPKQYTHTHTLTHQMFMLTRERENICTLRIYFTLANTHSRLYVCERAFACLLLAAPCTVSVVFDFSWLIYERQSERARARTYTFHTSVLFFSRFYISFFLLFCLILSVLCCFHLNAFRHTVKQFVALPCLALLCFVHHKSVCAIWGAFNQ